MPVSSYSFYFNGSKWVETQKLVAVDGGLGDLFGTDMAMDGGRVLISSHRNDEAGLDAGAGYVFNLYHDTWYQQAKLLPVGAGPGDSCSSAVALDGDLALLGAPQNSDAGPTAGSFHVFQSSGATWTDLGQVYSPNPLPDAGFGVAVDAGRIVAGAYKENGHAGAAYAFTLNTGECAGLSADVGSFSVAAGGTQALHLHAGLQHPDALYLVLGSVSGTSPGLSIGGFAIPLNPDPYFNHTVLEPGLAPLQGALDFLDGLGAGEAKFTLAPGAIPSAAGLTLNHAFVVIDPAAPGYLAYVSNPVALDLVP